MTERELRNLVAQTAAKYVGVREGSATHKQLIDIYNGDKPVPVGYPMKYTDAWCAAYVSVVAIICKLTKIVFKECGCGRMINLYKAAGRWMENDAYRPDAGDVIFYDWDDSGVGDNVGSSDHVGIVEKVSGSTITVIEGNYSDKVTRRTLTVNGRYIRGYGLPDYASVADGYTGGAAQDIVAPNKTVEQLADEVIQGLWGNGSERKQRLTAAGYNYAAVQSAVNARYKKKESEGTDTSGLAPASGKADAKTIWNTLMKMIGNPYGVAGLMGNMDAESALIANNLQNTGNARTGLSDAEYTAAVDAGTYTNFVNDYHGYGLCQWTYHTRKQALLNFARAKKASVGNLAMQLQFTEKEMTESYSGVWNTLKTAKSVREASDAVLMNFERPENASDKKDERAAFGQKYFNEYAGKTVENPPDNSKPSDTTPPAPAAKNVKAKDPAYSFSKSIAGTYTVRANGGLNVRDGAGTSKKVLVTIPNGTQVKNYGYYTNAGGAKWLYIQFTMNGVTYTGFASGNYLVK